MKSKLTKTAFFTQGARSTANVLNRFKKQTPGLNGRWGKIVGVESIEEADYLVVWGNRPPSNYNPQKIIQIQREPKFIEEFRPIKNAAHIIDYAREYHVVSWWVSPSFDELAEKKYRNKDKKCSVISSAKWGNRNSILKNLNKIMPPGLIDFYGRDLGKVISGKSYKGPLKNKYNGLIDYTYSIAIENSAQENYFTEKIADCFLSWTMPIYWGCPNISKYFPEDSYYKLDPSRLEDVIEIIQKPIEEKNIIALKKARELILYEYNVWPTLDRVIQGIK